MGLTRNVLERQLERAEARLKACEQQLADAGVSQDALSGHPTWRRAASRRRQVKRRLTSSDAWHSRGAAADQGDE